VARRQEWDYLPSPATFIISKIARHDFSQVIENKSLTESDGGHVFVL